MSHEFPRHDPARLTARSPVGTGHATPDVRGLKAGQVQPRGDRGRTGAPPHLGPAPPAAGAIRSAGKDRSPDHRADRLVRLGSGQLRSSAGTATMRHLPSASRKRSFADKALSGVLWATICAGRPVAAHAFPAHPRLDRRDPQQRGAQSCLFVNGLGSSCRHATAVSFRVQTDDDGALGDPPMPEVHWTAEAGTQPPSRTDAAGTCQEPATDETGTIPRYSYQPKKTQNGAKGAYCFHRLTFANQPHSGEFAKAS